MAPRLSSWPTRGPTASLRFTVTLFSPNFFFRTPSIVMAMFSAPLACAADPGRCARRRDL